MTETTNLGLIKIDDNENWRNIFDHYNNSMDAADTKVGRFESGLVAIANGNTHAALTDGQYIYVRNHSSLSDGMYYAVGSIDKNGSLTSSNLQGPLSKGALNSLNTRLTTANTIINAINTTVTNAGLTKTGSLNQYAYTYGFAVVGWGIMVPVSTGNTINITSASLFNENGVWITLSNPIISTFANVQRAIKFDYPSEGVTAGRVYLVNIIGSVTSSS